VDEFNHVQMFDGDDGVVMNIIQLHSNGFDVVMQMIWRGLNGSRRERWGEPVTR